MSMADTHDPNHTRHVALAFTSEFGSRQTTGLGCSFWRLEAMKACGKTHSGKLKMESVAFGQANAL